MDVETCEVRLIEAAWTLECLPDAEAKYRNGFKCLFPESVLDYKEIKGHDVPSAFEISRYEETLNWLRIIPPIREQKFVFQACLNQRGRKKYHIKWAAVRNRSGLGGSNYSCRTLYRSWIQTMARRNI